MKTCIALGEWLIAGRHADKVKRMGRFLQLFVANAPEISAFDVGPSVFQPIANYCTDTGLRMKRFELWMLQLVAFLHVYTCLCVCERDLLSHMPFSLNYLVLNFRPILSKLNMIGNIRNSHSGSYVFESHLAAVSPDLDFYGIPKYLQTDVHMEH
jgi:hypothetical protein